MIKTKKNNIHLPLVITGYILFFLLVVATLVSTTIPLGIMLFDPRVLHYNVAIIAVSLTVGAVLPVLVGYSIGDHSAKSKSKLSHHFNGMLFGLLAYGLMTLLAVSIFIPSDLFPDDNIRIIVMSLLPGAAVAIVSTILAVAHIRSRQTQRDILEYKPYVVLLIASIIVMPVWSLVSNILTNSDTLYSLISLVIVGVLGFISYVTLRKKRLSVYQKISWSAVSVSVSFVMAYVASQLVSSIANYLLPYATMEEQIIVEIVGFGLALAGWVVYWVKQTRKL